MIPGPNDLEPSSDDVREALRDLFKDIDEEELVSTLEEFEALERELAAKGPRNPDELWEWIRDNLGIELTRHKVCEDHTAPFDVLCDMFFEEKFQWPHPQLGMRDYGGVGSILVMANRGGSKTFLVALLHFLNSTFKPGCEGVTFGATEEQSKRCYNHLTPWVTVVREDPRTGKKRRQAREGIDYSQRSETVWEGVDDLHGNPVSSKVEILSGTKEAVNGPHPNVAHADEVEQMKDETWDESRNMAIAGKDAYGRPIRPRNIGTSTRKSKHGRMQMLINEIKKALANGMIPMFELCVWCIWETAAQVPNCRMAAENADLSPDDPSLCQCHRIPRGVWDDGTTRTLDTVCDGKLYRSRGWQPLEQVQELFRQNSRPVWEAQQECREPETEHNYIQGWREERSVLQWYDPDPQLGPIFQSVDFGTVNAVNWYQYLYYDTEVVGFDHEWRTIPAGSLVCFDEIYKADIGAGKLAERVIARENAWRSVYPDFRVFARFGDPANRQQRTDFKENGIKTSWWKATRDVQMGIDLAVDAHEGRWQGLNDTRGFIFVARRNEVQESDPTEEVACAGWRMEVEFWRKNPKTGLELQDLNHTMANWRYLLVNLDKGMGTHVASVRQTRPKDEFTPVKAVSRPSKKGPLRLGGPQTSPVASHFGQRP